MRAGVLILPEYPAAEARSLWARVESLGFDHAWTYDHLGWRLLLDDPWFGAVPTLALAAGATSSIELGTLVSSPDVRHPVAFARDIITLDDHTSGRLTLGLGAGPAHSYDSRVFGSAQPSHRGKRFEEFVTLLHLLLTEDRVNFNGEFYTAVDARRTPGCVQLPRVPFIVAGEGARAMEVATRFGSGWVTIGAGGDTADSWWRGVQNISDRFHETIARNERVAGRMLLVADMAPFRAMESAARYADTLGRAHELGFTDLVTAWPRHDGVFAGSERVAEKIAVDVLPQWRRT